MKSRQRKYAVTSWLYCCAAKNRVILRLQVFAILKNADNMHISYGGIAQLVERLHGMQEVSGSIPLTSTKILKSLTLQSGFFHACC